MSSDKDSVAPDRIWITKEEVNGRGGYFATPGTPASAYVEYIRVQPSGDEVEVARAIIRKHCRQAALLASEELIVNCESALAKDIACALHSAHSRAVEEAAKAMCEFCRNSSYPTAYLNDEGEWVHCDANHASYCQSGKIRALSVKDEKNQD